MPAPGLRWLVLASPRAVTEERAFWNALRELVSERAFQDLSARNGFDLRQSASALVAGFDFGTLYLVSADGHDARITEHFQSRLLQGAKVARPHPRLTRITGVAGTTPEALLRAEQQLVAVAVDDPSLVRLVEGYLLGRFRKTPTALRGAALAELAEFARDAPVRAFFPGPFDEHHVPGPLRGALLASATAVACAVSIRDRDATGAPDDSLTFHVRLALAGDWSRDETASSRLHAAWQALSVTSPGRWFGLDRPVSPATVRASASLLELELDLDGRRLLEATRDAAHTELTELFGESTDASHMKREGHTLDQ